MKKLLVVIILLLSVSTTNAQISDLDGNWKGQINAQGQELVIKTHFRQDSSGYSGTIDIPQQGASDIKLQKIRVTAQDSVFFQFMAGPGLAKFTGKIKTDSTISGSFYQGGMQFPFKLKRDHSNTEKPKTENKEGIKAALPYNHKDLIIKNDSIDIGGTLTWPKERQSSTLVIMISGSGAQDRDESLKPLSDFKPFAVLADSLTTNGIATFRYDDRGVDKSTGNFGNTTLDMLASDVEAIITDLTKMPDHNFEEIILLGHSQGGVVGGKVAAEDKGVDKLILMASTGVSLQKVSNFQVRQAIARSGATQKQIEDEMAARQQLYEAFQKQQNLEEAKENHTKQFLKLLQSIEENQQNAESLRKQAQLETNGILAAYSNPQFQSLYSYDPTTDLRNIDIPVLVLFGGKDTQVSVNLNKEPIEKALNKASISHKVKTFKQANHLFQKAKTGTVSEYGKLENEFVDGFLKTIGKWIKKDY